MNGSFVGGLQRRNQNTQTTGLDLLFNLRCSGLTAASTAVQSFAVAQSLLGQAQLRPENLANPLLAAPTASPLRLDNEPQQGLRFFATHVMLADPSGTLRTTGDTIINLYNVTQGISVWDSPFIVSPGAEPSAEGQAAIYMVSGGNGDTNKCFAIQPYDQLQVQLQMPGGTGSATGVNVLVFGIWVA